MDLNRLHEILSYDPTTGDFRWRVDRGGKARAGSIAGSVHPDGYRFIKINRVSHAAHRLAFMYMTGSEPPNQIDHINQDGTDNRWINLRPATQSQNCVNRHRTNVVGEGLRGVCRCGNRFQAAISIREHGVKRRLHLGMFDTAQEAHAAYLTAAVERYGEFLPGTKAN